MSDLRAVVQHHLPDLRTLSEERAAHRPGSQVWWAKQMPGHLIDSGVNHQARVVRAGAIGGGEPITLDFLALDDVRHPLHHLAQISGGVGA
ncbi:hypothetical protein [Deinococcus sp. Leaf326]|uniref:hypothetical protein n=1 Tax=Deinococcus sp. Leaf326 TaxID=1736338 RepID=UPI0006F37192|nr:hypothetical protein [Deinococcus sp. Leaf326]KQR04541.1 hypothetical protein ASF71_10910 [Deinococcus sp. Leaf326]